MDDAELTAMLDDLPSDRSERTVSRDKIDEFGEAICAFANDLPNHDKPAVIEVDFPGATAYRNPVLAEAAKNLGFVNRFGRGVPRTQEAALRNGSPLPEFIPKGRHFLVILRKRP